MRLPCAISVLSASYKDARKEALKVYKKHAICDDDSTEASGGSEGEQAVIKQCKGILEVTKINNEQACTFACTQLLNQYHSEIMSSLASGDHQSSDNKEQVFANMDQVEAALHQIELSFEREGPEGEDLLRHLIFEKFRSQIAFETATHFVRN